MGATVNVLNAGMATGIGSLPHVDPAAAAALVLRATPELPSVPYLPQRCPFDSLASQAACGVPELALAADGSFTRRVGVPVRIDGPIDTTIAAPFHTSLIAFVDAAVRAPRRPRAVKVQVCGPLTFGAALVGAGVAPSEAYPRAARVVVAWADAIIAFLETRLPEVQTIVFFDEPALGDYARGNEPVVRDDAIDLLSRTFASIGGVTGVHVNPGGDVRMALDAGPTIVGVAVSDAIVQSALGVSRFLEGGGFLAWGAIPVDRPLGERPVAQWKDLAAVWCDLTRRGCDAEQLRRQAIVTPAHGLVGHGTSQAERVLELTREIGGYVREQAIATRLTIGA